MDPEKAEKQAKIRKFEDYNREFTHVWESRECPPPQFKDGEPLMITINKHVPEDSPSHMAQVTHTITLPERAMPGMPAGPQYGLAVSNQTRRTFMRGEYQMGSHSGIVLKSGQWWETLVNWRLQSGRKVALVQADMNRGRQSYGVRCVYNTLSNEGFVSASFLQQLPRRVLAGVEMRCTQLRHTTLSWILKGKSADKNTLGVVKVTQDGSLTAGILRRTSPYLNLAFEYEYTPKARDQRSSLRAGFVREFIDGSSLRIQMDHLARLKGAIGLVLPQRKAVIALGFEYDPKQKQLKQGIHFSLNTAV